MTKWKLVPVEPTPEMQKAGAEVPLNKAARHNVVFRRMLEAAPQPPKLSDDRIREILVNCNREDKTVRDFALAIEREILGRLGMTEAIDVARSAEKGGAA